MLIKETLIRESIKQGILVKDESSKLFKIDRGVTDGIFDFLVEKQDIIGRDRWDVVGKEKVLWRKNDCFIWLNVCCFGGKFMIKKMIKLGN